MLRIDRGLFQARLLRVRRAARTKVARGEISIAGNFGTKADVQKEEALARRLVDDFLDEPVSSGANRAEDGEVETVLDAKLVETLKADLFVGLMEMLDENQVSERILASFKERFFRRAGVPDGVDPIEFQDQNRARLAGMNDLVPLVLEAICQDVFEAMQRYHDRLRQVPAHVYDNTEVVFDEKGRLTRLCRDPSGALVKTRRRTKKVPVEADMLPSEDADVASGAAMAKAVDPLALETSHGE